MLYKTIIADDENRILANLKKSINWNRIGFEIVGTADNGEKAFELISVLKPHVVVTDLVMPKLDGLGLARKTLNLYPETFFIILSAFDEFRYAQQAVRIGVS